MLRISMVAGLALLAAGCGDGGANGYDRDETRGVAAMPEYAPEPAAPPMDSVTTSADGYARERQIVQQEQGGGGQPGQTEPGQTAPAQLIVAGGPGTHSVYVPCFGNSRAVSVEVESR